MALGRRKWIFIALAGALVLAFAASAPLRDMFGQWFERSGYVLVLAAITLGVALLSMLVLKKLGPTVWTVIAIFLGLCTFGGALLMTGASGWDEISYFLLLAGVLVPLLGGWLLGGAYLFYRWRKQGVRGGDAAASEAQGDQAKRADK